MAAVTCKKIEPADSNDYKTHPIVGDRIIEGEGTSQETWRQWPALQTMTRLDITTAFDKGGRVCVFIPHPDDEILGCAGLLQHLAANDNRIVLVYVTNGTQSHPHSTLYPPDKLNIIRPKESLAALNVLGIGDCVTSIALEMTDGTVFDNRVLLYQKMGAITKPDDILITPFAFDGHPDHEATGQVVTAFARARKLMCYQVLIWAWHWAIPDDKRIPWHKAVRVDLNDEQLIRKNRAIACFESQITIDDSTNNPPVLSEQAIARVSQPWEVYLHE